MKANIVILNSKEARENRTISLSTHREITLGRSRRCDVPLSDIKLSRIHCTVFYQDNKFLIKDNGSTNGTYVRDQNIDKPVALAHENIIRIGDTAIRFLIEGLQVNPIADNAEPEFIGDYQVIEQIGKGGIGTVYKGAHRQNNNIVALKLLKPEAADDKKAVERFIREARVCASLDHPSIVKTLDFGISHDGISHGNPYIVLEYVPSPPLSDLLNEQGRLSPVRSLRIVEQVAEALVCSHTYGIIHRDIKPSNILVSSDLEVKLIDMGLVKVIHESGLTISGQAMGTPRYMSPEQIVDSKSIDHRTDIYALGATLYGCLSGRPPYYEITGKRIADLLRQIYSSSPQPLRELVSDLPEIVDKLVAKAMARNPGDRFRNAKAFLKSIRKVKKKLEKSL